MLTPEIVSGPVHGNPNMPMTKEFTFYDWAIGIRSGRTDTGLRLLQRELAIRSMLPEARLDEKKEFNSLDVTADN